MTNFREQQPYSEDELVYHGHLDEIEQRITAEQRDRVRAPRLVGLESLRQTTEVKPVSEAESTEINQAA